MHRDSKTRSKSTRNKTIHEFSLQDHPEAL